VEIFRRYKLVIIIINSTVLNKLQSYSPISALGQEGHCTSRFKRVMCISCRLHVDVHKGGGEGVWLMWTHVDRGSQKSDVFVDVINAWPRRRPPKSSANRRSFTRLPFNLIPASTLLRLSYIPAHTISNR